MSNQYKYGVGTLTIDDDKITTPRPGDVTILSQRGVTLDNVRIMRIESDSLYCKVALEFLIDTPAVIRGDLNQMHAMQAIAERMDKPFRVTFDDGKYRYETKVVPAEEDWSTADALLPTLTALARKLRGREDEPWP